MSVSGEKTPDVFTIILNDDMVALKNAIMCLKYILYLKNGVYYIVLGDMV